MATQPNPEARPPRVLMVSLRRVNTHAAWCSNYEFEDVIRSVDDVEMVTLEPARAKELRQRVARGLAWRSRHLPLPHVNPGVRSVELSRDYDVFVFVCMNVWDLLFLNAIVGWEKRCAKKLCYMVEIYAGQMAEIQHLLRPLEAFDHVFQSFSGSVEAIHHAVTKPCSHVPLAADLVRFTPYPDPRPRVIDILSIGRRSEPLHQVLRRVANDQRLLYMYDTIPGPLVRPSNAVEHREMLATSARQSRLFITFPAKFGDDENKGQSEVGARYYEAAAAGAVMLGKAPTARAFRSDFPWPDVVIEPKEDGSDLAEVVLGTLGRPDEMARASRRNAVAALRQHDWAHRWRAMLETVAVPPRPALGERVRKLDALADGAAQTGVL